MIDQLLLSKVEQDNEYIIMKSSNNNEEYKVISFSSSDKLSKNQKMSSSAIVNKFYLKIWSIEKKHSSEL